MAAIHAVASLLKPGDHLVAGSDLYGGTYRLFEQILRPLGIEASYADARDPKAVAASLRDTTRLVWLETPTNPLLHLTDIAAIARLLKRRRDVLLAVDNTFATPALQQPLSLGADVVVHSTTKYLGGHSDVVGGAVLTNDERVYESIRFWQNAAGAVPSPFDAWLTLRGIKTLEVRMQRHLANAQRIAEYLSSHPKVRRVYYPGLPTHPQHELARRQMRGFGGMVSFSIEGGRPAVERFARRLQVFSFAESLGGVESLACQPATMTHGSIPKAQRLAAGIDDSLIRLSIGLEDPEDLIADLRQALPAARKTARRKAA
jgi:cystathionine beta-lyase/cystathionine gamma-synthase